MAIALEIAGGIARVHLNRPEKLNALTLAMRESLRDHFRDLQVNDSVRAVVVSGAGRAFCAGADVAGLAGNDTRSDLEDVTNPLILNLHGLNKPVIAAVNGLAVGMGWSLALACDSVVAARSARFALSQTKVGLVADVGSIWFLSRIVGRSRAFDIAATGRTVESDEALELGLVSEVVNDGNAVERALEIATRLIKGSRPALGMTKRLLDAATSPTLAEFLVGESLIQTQLAKGLDHAEGIAAFLARRQPEFKA